MALTAYCKKCGREVEPGEICSRCGTRLGRNAAHAAWCMERTPVKDWMYWNSVIRLLLPAAAVVLLLALLVEWIGGGAAAAEQMLSADFPVTLLILLAAVLIVTFVILLLQGKELSDFVVDSRGVHETRYLPKPTRLKLILRLKSFGQLTDNGESGTVQVIRISQRDLPWKNVSRVQLWPEKCMVLFYAPVWWLRIPALCTPFVWDDVMDFIREKLGKKKKVKLPSSLMSAGTPAASGRRMAQPQQLRMEDLEPAEPEEMIIPEAAEEGAGPTDFAGDAPKA